MKTSQIVTNIMSQTLTGTFSDPIDQKAWDSVKSKNPYFFLKRQKQDRQQSQTYWPGLDTLGIKRFCLAKRQMVKSGLTDIICRFRNVTASWDGISRTALELISPQFISDITKPQSIGYFSHITKKFQFYGKSS